MLYEKDGEDENKKLKVYRGVSYKESYFKRCLCVYTLIFIFVRNLGMLFTNTLITKYSTFQALLLHVFEPKPRLGQSFILLLSACNLKDQPAACSSGWKYNFSYGLECYEKCFLMLI